MMKSDRIHEPPHGCGDEANNGKEMLREQAEHKGDQRHYYRNLCLRSVATFGIGLVLMALLKTYGLGSVFLAALLYGCFALLFFTL